MKLAQAKMLLLHACAWASSASAAVFQASGRHPAWQRTSAARGDELIKLHIALRPADEEAAARALLKASDPKSAHYRRHLDAKSIQDLSRPEAAGANTVNTWLAEHGLVPSEASSPGLLEIETTIRSVERLLKAEYSIYRASDDAHSEVVRTERFEVPDAIATHFDFIAPTTVFPKPRVPRVQQNPVQQTLSQQKRDTCGSSDNTTPTCVRQIYGIDYTAQPNRTTFAVYGTEAASFNPADLQTYLSKFNPPAAAASATYTVVGSGAPNESSSSIEAKFETALDTQSLLGVAWPASGILYLNGGVFGPNAGQTYDRFVRFLQELITNTTVPSVVSFSESMPENHLDEAYARRLCSMMAQVGARGVSLLFSSGDNGPNGDTASGTHDRIFETEFPASCPWVTAVGGTTNLANETAATGSTISALDKLTYAASGGGFSAIFPAPPYQAEVTRAYTSKYVPASYANVSGYNAAGRGVPDVSAFSTGFPTVVSLVLNIPLTIPIGGTSASTPTWAAVVTLLNDYEASQGRPPLGFLNPWLYSLRNGTALKDITTGGNNKGSCNFLGGCKLPETLGYDVTVGWDPVTGLGSPLWKGLVAALDTRASRRQRHH